MLKGINKLLTGDLLKASCDMVLIDTLWAYQTTD